MKMRKTFVTALAAASLILTGHLSSAAVSKQEAAKLGTELTPLGSEKEGNKEGTIPAWTGGLTTPTPGFKNGGKRPDPFPGEKPLFSITAKNMAEYSDKLTDGSKAMLAKYPSTYRIDVYPTHRTAAAPEWVYENTAKNAVAAKMQGDSVTGAYGGVPFPIPQSGKEVMWNHLLRWRGTAWHMDFSGLMGTADGKRVLLLQTQNEHQMPYYFKEGSVDKFDGAYWLVRSVNSGPPIRAGEAIVGRENTSPEKVGTWVYLTGQRRVRKLPNSNGDTPTPFSAGISTFDEVDVFNGAATLGRFDWKIVGKKEIFIPYNTNKTYGPTLEGVFVGQHLNPDSVRWELHRVWVVEASIREGQRHTSPKTRYYVDEDSWIAVLADRWDAKGQLWRTLFSLPIAMPDIPATATATWGFYELLSGTSFVNVLFNDKNEVYRSIDRYPNQIFTPEALAGEGIR